MSLALDGTNSTSFAANGPGVLTGNLDLTTSSIHDVACLAIFWENASNFGTAGTRSITVSSTSGLVWTRRKSLTWTSENNSYLELWWAPAAAALTSEDITFDFSDYVDGYAAWVFGVSGANYTSPWDANSSLPGSSSSTSSDATEEVTGLGSNSTNPFVIELGGSASEYIDGDASSGYTVFGTPPFANNHGSACILGAYDIPGSALSGTVRLANGREFEFQNYGMIVDAIVPALPGESGTWASTEAVDTFAGTGYVAETGTWASTEAKDVFAATGFGPPASGTWASTERKDIVNFLVSVNEAPPPVSVPGRRVFFTS